MPDDPAVRVQKAIRDYEEAKKVAGRQAPKRAKVLWLGSIDDPEVTAYLQRELAAQRDTPLAAAICEAIGQVRRPILQAELLELAQRSQAPAAARTAAALAAAKLGDQAIDALVHVASTNDEKVVAPVRESIALALAGSGIDRAQRGLAPLLVGDDKALALKVLRRMEAVAGVPPVSASRIKLVRTAELELAAVAWRQLCVEGHDSARGLTVDMLERIVGEPAPAVAAELIGGLVRVRDADFYPVLLRFAASSADVVRKALKTAAPAAAQDPALLKYLVAKGIDDARPGGREAARLLLAAAPPEAVQPLVERLRADLRAGRRSALDQAAGLHDLLAKDPGWVNDLLVLAQASDSEQRLLGLALLLELGADVGIPIAQQSLGHRSWELRSLAYRYLTRCRAVSSIPLLIARYEREEGRLAAELDQALFVHAGARCWSRHEWETWWQKRQKDFVLPHPDSVKTGGGSASRTAAYHDIPIVSSRLCFLVDRSGSMKEKVGTDKKRTRLDEAKQQLAQVIAALPATTMANLIVYETDVEAVWEHVRKLTDAERADLLEKAAKIMIGGGTNIFDSLEVAFADDKVDTIYLLTDGQPTSGRLTDPDEIVEEVRRWNRTRQVVIHCISVGLDSDLLKRLAKMSGGTYKFVR
jgi:hypothetical protein